MADLSLFSNLRPPATAAVGTGAKRTGSAPPSRPGPSPTSAAGKHSLIFELDFGRFWDLNSGHFRSVFEAKGYRFGHPRAACACGGSWTL
ncbi:unnamed protein product [Prunus armeniaca]